jgi:predicted phage-related endonuclease
MRPFTIVHAEQRSDEWFLARLGRLTGSRAADMLATIKSGEAAARRDLRTQLVVERLTQTLQEESFINAAMQRGMDLEPAAFAAYEALTGNVAERTGFLSHNTLAIGCSLDGHVGEFDGITEFKCPKSATHLRYLRAGVVPQDYLPQITHNLWVTGAQWCDFLSFDDRFPLKLQTFLVRVDRDELAIAAYAEKALAFLSEVDREVVAIRTISDFPSVLKEAVSVA